MYNQNNENRNLNANISDYSDSANEFIDQSSINQQQEMQKMFAIFQKMSSDPAMFMKMMGAVNTSQDNSSRQQPPGRQRQFQVEQHKYRNHKVSPRKSPTAVVPETLPKKQNRKKGGDLLASYLPANQQNPITSNYIQNQSLTESQFTSKPYQNKSRSPDQQKQLPSTTQYINPYDQIPIKSKYTEGNQNMDFYQFQNSYVGKKGNEMGNEGQFNNSEVMMNNTSNKYIEAEERPITGIKGDFKAYLQNIDGISQGNHQNQEEDNTHKVRQEKKVKNINELDEYPNEEDEEGNRAKQPQRQFLKRGSRQYLSSAKDKSVAKKKPKGATPKNVSKNAEEPSQQRPARSISQNRVLGQKNKSNTNKSVAKKPAAGRSPQNNRNNFSSGYTSNVNKKTPVNQSKLDYSYEQKQSSPTFKETQKYHKNPQKPPVQPPKKATQVKEKKKNIFHDSSSEQSEHQNGQGNWNDRNYNTKQSSITNSSSKMQKFQVIQGVFLTNKQLYQILNKYGSSQNKKPNNDEDRQTIKQLKTKYIDLCNVLTQQKKMFEEQMEKQKHEFQVLKQSQLTKIKNERKIQQRNMLASKKEKDSQKEKEQFEAKRKQLEKQLEQSKKKDKNNRIMLQKYKKQVQQLKKQLSASSNANLPSTSNNNNVYNPFPGSQNSKKQSSQHQAASNKTTQQQKHPSYSQQQQYMSGEKKQSTNSFLPNYNDLKKKGVGTKNKKYQYHEQKPQFEEQKMKKSAKTKNYFKNDDSNSQSSNDQKQQYQQEHKYIIDREEEKVQSQTQKQEIVQYNKTMKLSDLTKIPLTIKMVNEDMIENLFRYQTNSQYIHYKQMTRQGRTKIHTSKNAMDKKTTNIYSDGGKQVIFETGVRKQYFNNGFSIIYFPNGDIKMKLSDETVMYFYNEKQVDQITLTDKTNIYRFDNNQVEFHYPDGHIEIRHPDGTFKAMENS